MRFSNFNLSGHRNHHGSAIVESLIAITLVSVSLLASGRALRGIQRAETSANEKFRLSIAIEAARAEAAQEITSQWLAIANSGCVPDTEELLSLVPQTEEGDTLRILNREEIDRSFDPDLKTEIEQVQSTFGDDAFSKCADTTTLADQNLSLLASSKFNQTLCRCAVAQTGYETLSSPKVIFNSQNGYYGCVVSDGGATFSKAVFEMVAYITPTRTGGRLDCDSIYNSSEVKFTKKVDYFASLKSAPVESVSGTYFLPAEGGVQ